MDLVVFLILLGLGYGFGRVLEKRHYRSIIRREQEFSDILVVATHIAPSFETPPDSQLVAGNVCISVDFFKRFVAGLRKIVGGRIVGYESLLDRARREAILRMKEEARALGANMVFNIKLETSSISKGRKGKVGSVEVLAYGTALIPRGVQ